MKTRKCECCRKVMYRYPNRRFCSTECRSMFRKSVKEYTFNDSIQEPTNQQEEELMNTLIAERSKEIRMIAVEHIERRTPIDDSPQAEVRLRRYLRLKRKSGRFVYPK